MYARVVTVQLNPGMAERAENIFRDSVLPAARAQQGFREGMLLTDRDTGKFHSISFWETEDDLNASEKNGYYQEQIVRFAGVGIFCGPPFRETFELSVRS